jgi:creatinine amidohydrolase
MSRHWADLTWTEVRALLDRQTDASPLVAILPAGATEAHGPHLPLQTDRVIAIAMAERGADELERRGVTARVLPPLDFTAAPFARGFPGTISVRPETVTALVVDVGVALASQGVRILALANAHLDPAHLGALYAAIQQLETLDAAAIRVIFPDITRKPWALRLTDEFRSGACHAGRYEASVVMAYRPDLVHLEVQRRLPANPTSLSDAIRAGKDRFESAGGDQAYFGDPATASREEGDSTAAILGEIVAEAVRSALS